MGKNLVEIIVTAEDKASGVLNGVRGTLAGVGRVAAGAALGGIAAVAGGFAIAGGAAISMNSTLETATLQFGTLMGDAEAAEAHVASLFDFAARTPFETEPILQASKHLQVFGGDALNTMENLTLVGDASAALGQNFDEVAFWTGRLYSNLMGGQPFGEAAMRLQEMGIMAPEARAQLEAMQEAGASGTEIFATFQGQLGSFSGAMESQAGTWEGLTSTIKDNLQLLAAEALAPFFELAKSGMESLIAWINDPRVQAGIQKISETITAAIQVVVSFINNLREGMSPIDAFIEAIWDMAPEPVLDALINFRDNILPGIRSAFEAVATPIVNFITQHVQVKDVLIALAAIITGTLLVALWGIVTAVAPILLVMGAVIAVVALVRNAWESNWGGIQEKTAAVWAFIQPILENVKNWIVTVVIPALQELWNQWVTVVWPAIQAALQTAWGIIQPILIDIKDFIVDTVIPAVQDLYTKWVEDVWPTIQTVTENVWTIIETIFTEVGRWINDNIVPWVEYLRTKWVDEVWPAIQGALETAWAVIEPIWTAIQEWMETTIPPILTALQTTWEGVMSGLSAAIQPVKDVWDGLVGAVQGFWEWIKGKVFNFEFSLPDLPDWAIPGSPLPIHTAWKAFASDMAKIGAVVGRGFTAAVPESFGARLDVNGRLAGGGPGPASTLTRSVVVNIDARGAARGVDRDLRGMVEDVMREYGLRADARMRTS